jgi:hypothetical protein
MLGVVLGVLKMNGKAKASLVVGIVGNDKRIYS